jgi:hypothetical protein
MRKCVLLLALFATGCTSCGLSYKTSSYESDSLETFDRDLILICKEKPNGQTAKKSI